MSRSRNKHPKVNFVSYLSNKEDKTAANRKMRRTNKQIIRSNMSYEKILYPDGPDLLDTFNNPVWYDWWEEYPIEENLTNADFKNIREISDTYDFASDGLSYTISKYSPIYDLSKYPSKTTLDEALRNHNWPTIKFYYSK